ncbi:enoyl-CoA delta isomerase 2 [Phymastichus coffea]|uniref:enoyl-CoA delta isomerase 2 n=1 Tax=Phymastichus coffea TaxID=108790 RepID=UPI00273C8018|nr:enoyl-CoA delta isomerase 2 [Phymastichus coffea]XP_058801977.1 enoyl-CoA delta isomerase 2 [Phymastichus coffea]
MFYKPESVIITNFENNIQRVILNRPSKKNAITKQMYLDLTTIITESAKNDAVHALVMTGNGDFYSSGNDFVSYMMESTDIDERDTSEVKNFVDTLILYPKLLIAIVNGPAVGIAATTLALFDIVYACDTAYFWTPFCKLGLSPEGCSSYTFSKIMGPSKTSEVLFFGEKLTAREAAHCGLVSKVYKPGAVDEVWSHINKIASLSKESMASTKKLLSRWNQKVLLEVNKEEMNILSGIYRKSDFVERVFQFMSKKSKI